MGKKIIDIEIPPLVASQYLAYCLAILQTDSRTKDYYYNHYIQWICHTEYNKNNIYLEFENSSCFNCPEVQTTWIAKSDIKDVIQTIRESVDSGNFVLIDGADVFYLEHTLGFQKSHYGHDFLVYGYDDDTSVIYIMAYSTGRKLEKYACSQSAIVKAFTSDYVDIGFGCACPVRARDGELIQIDRKEIRMELERYLQKENHQDLIQNSDTVCGYQVYEYMLKYMSKDDLKEVLLFPKDLRVFMEHKKAMLHRILRLQKDFPEEAFSDIAKDYQKIYSKAEIFWVLLLKYDQTKAIKFLERMKNLIIKIEKEEYYVLKSLVSML